MCKRLTCGKKAKREGCKGDMLSLLPEHEQQAMIDEGAAHGPF